MRDSDWSSRFRRARATKNACKIVARSNSDLRSCNLSNPNQASLCHLTPTTRASATNHTPPPHPSAAFISPPQLRCTGGVMVVCGRCSCCTGGVGMEGSGMCLFLHQHQQVMAPAQGAAGGDGPAHQLAHESNMPPNQALGQPLPINDEPGGGYQDGDGPRKHLHGGGG